MVTPYITHHGESLFVLVRANELGQKIPESPEVLGM